MPSRGGGAAHPARSQAEPGSEELERAAQTARADAEAAQAEVERPQDQAEAIPTEAEPARAEEERERRRTTLALAASVMLLVGLGSGGWLYRLRQDASRKTAEAHAQRQHAAEMQELAEERDRLRIAVERARAIAESAQQDAQTAEDRARELLYATDMQRVDALLKENDPRAGRSPPVPPEQTLIVSSLAFSLDGRYLVAGLGGFGLYFEPLVFRQWPLAVYDVGAERLLTKLEGHRNQVMSLVYSPDGSLLASASHDGTVRLWDTTSWQTVRVLKNPDRPDAVESGDNGIADIAFSPDGRQLAAASLAGNVHVFEADTGVLLEIMRDHAGMVHCIAYSASGRTLVSGGADGTVRLWNLSTGRQFAAGSPTVCWTADPLGVNRAGRLAENLKRTLEAALSFSNRIGALSHHFAELRRELESTTTTRSSSCVKGGKLSNTSGSL